VVSKQRFVVMKSKEAEEYKGFETENPFTQLVIDHYLKTNHNGLYALIIFRDELITFEDSEYWIQKAKSDGEIKTYESKKKREPLKYYLTSRFLKIVRRSISMMKEFHDVVTLEGKEKLQPQRLSKLSENIIRTIFEVDDEICTTKVIAKELHKNNDWIRVYANNLKKQGYLKRVIHAWELTPIGYAYIEYYCSSRPIPTKSNKKTEEKENVIRELGQDE
jgi:hypothetical protein